MKITIKSRLFSYLDISFCLRLIVARCIKNQNPIKRSNMSIMNVGLA